jgi:hypothetical protein
MKTKIALIVLFLASVSFNAFAAVQPGNVEIPLDGGLLAILGAAGVAYFVARKKKKSQES